MFAFESFFRFMKLSGMDSGFNLLSVRYGNVDMGWIWSIGPMDHGIRVMDRLCNIR